MCAALHHDVYFRVVFVPVVVERKPEVIARRLALQFLETNVSRSVKQSRMVGRRRRNAFPSADRLNSRTVCAAASPSSFGNTSSAA